MAYKIKSKIMKGSYKGRSYNLKKAEGFSKILNPKDEYDVYVIEDKEPLYIGSVQTKKGGKNIVKKFVDRGEYSI